MAYALIMVSVEVDDSKVTPDTGTSIQATIESAVQQTMVNLEEYGAVSFVVTFEDMV